jgi:hypothetical protein
MKTILSIWNSGNKGKTETLREFANLLLLTYPRRRIIFSADSIVPDTGDFRLVVEINGKIIGIESQGDPKTELQNRLIELADVFKCKLILCSTRTRGETVAAVDHLFDTRNFQTLWTSTYQIANARQHDLVNELKAKHLLDLLQSLSLI